MRASSRESKGDRKKEGRGTGKEEGRGWRT